ncbi:MAG TPA: radical SAM protein [candidate division Zixibacteria bacterium]|nr:radical SAM protein [candidate division Zixibacteria bacterium]MDD4917813.1 radical SAM protein [candidate division Zixibacteria bacterium]MDM7974211.1 radical SAM protein [candidate division Zixibacteria bacterium]HOD66072.1 radical SAM protein [candidate division Zixibacteria bacterium]HPC10865.1 radical SAM protein [candidate division Zixibacteria bacterium]
MPTLSRSRMARIAARTLANMARRRPINVSFEITYNCNARCEHCDLGDYVKEPRLGPEVFADWLTRLKPAVAQISGGEPLLRKDLVDIVRAMRERDPVPVFVITTNVQIMTEKKYLQLREAGMDEFSFSLDYPDDRHSAFRHLKDNFRKMSELVPTLAAHGHKDIVLACVVQSDNFRDLPKIAELAREWGVGVNFSTYNALRTGKKYYLITSPQDLAELETIVDRLAAMQREGYPIMTSEWTMRQMIDFFRTGGHPRCRAGERFMIVNPWGKLTPCGMCRDHYDDPAQIRERFSRTNECGDCYTAIRANSEKTPYRLIADALRVVRR